MNQNIMLIHLNISAAKVIKNSPTKKKKKQKTLIIGEK